VPAQRAHNPAAPVEEHDQSRPCRGRSVDTHRQGAAQPSMVLS
jgi:hypothetical protein